MAVGYDSSGFAQSSFNNTFTLSFAMPTLTDSALVAGWGTREANDITSSTYNGDALTLGKLQENDGVCTAVLWYMVAPDVGTANLVGNADEFNLWDGGAVALSGVDQSTPV